MCQRIRPYRKALTAPPVTASDTNTAAAAGLLNASVLWQLPCCSRWCEEGRAHIRAGEKRLRTDTRWAPAPRGNYLRSGLSRRLITEGTRETHRTEGEMLKYQISFGGLWFGCGRLVCYSSDFTWFVFSSGFGCKVFLRTFELVDRLLIL